MIDSEKLSAALTLAADFTATAQAVNDAHAEQRAILQAVRERIAADKRRAEERSMNLMRCPLCPMSRQRRNAPPLMARRERGRRQSRIYERRGQP